MSANRGDYLHRPVALAYHERRCRWHRCRGPLAAERASRQYCSTRCRIAGHRARQGAARLRQCKVERIEKREARALIRRNEFLGTAGNCVVFFGLRDPNGKLWSLVGFGHGPHGAATITLERGYTR